MVTLLFEIDFNKAKPSLLHHKIPIHAALPKSPIYITLTPYFLAFFFSLCRHMYVAIVFSSFGKK